MTGDTGENDQSGKYYDDLRAQLVEVGLTEREADIAVKYHIHGLTTGAIADNYDVERGTISSALRKIRNKREKAEKKIPELEKRVEVLTELLEEKSVKADS